MSSNRKDSKSRIEKLGFQPVKNVVDDDYVDLEADVHIPKPNKSNGSSGDKYWIKQGLAVVHKDFLASNIKMVVDNIVKKSGKDHMGNDRAYIVGVKCHWFTSDGKYNTGMFFTTELRQWKEDGKYD